MKAYFASFPLDLIEAAKVDGASEWRAFVSVVLPLSRGTLVAVGLVQSISLWNELALAAVLLVAPSSRTLTIGLALFQGQQVVDRAGQFATLTLMIAPIVILYVVFERRITEGIRLGALK
jgi:ABC-type glycerol-3-phosphate transport system permease component